MSLQKGAHFDIMAFREIWARTADLQTSQMHQKKSFLLPQRGVADRHPSMTAKLPLLGIADY